MTTNGQSKEPWEDELVAFEAADRACPPPPGAVLFVGSSTIRLWTHLPQDFPGVPVLNRGFGGSSIPDVLAAMDRIVTPYRPRTILFYCGDNDLGNGRSTNQILRDIREFVARAHRALPAAPIVFISIKPSPCRWALADKMKSVNAAVRDMADRDPLLKYADVFTPMLGDDGQPRKNLYIEDGLHMSRAGYELWKNLLQPYVK